MSPGLIALAGGLSWDVVPVLPGLVCSGGALLFGVNTWCLDGRGALWRDSLPASPTVTFAVRAWVLTEVLLVSELVTVGLALGRAGPVGPALLTALAVTLVVLPVQVVAAAMTWSGARPYAVDLRSARSTPAPPTVMVGYSARLALSTTLTSVLIATTAAFGSWAFPVVTALPFLLFSARRLVRAHRRWCDPVQRAGVVATVAG